MYVRVVNRWRPLDRWEIDIHEYKDSVDNRVSGSAQMAFGVANDRVAPFQPVRTKRTVERFLASRHLAAHQEADAEPVGEAGSGVSLRRR
jgi:hypothetical protein